MNRLSPHDPRIARAIELRRRGLSVAEICVKVGARRETVLAWIEGVEVWPRPVAPAPYATGYRWGRR